MLPSGWSERLAIPAVAAPMTGVSGPELVAAACAAGVIGAFPTHNAATTGQLQEWLGEIKRRAATLDPEGRGAPMAANVVVHRSNARRDDDIAALLRAGVELVITSVGSPKDVVPRLHEAGTTVFADVATLRHAELAVHSGVDGLILLTAGAGGQTGWANPFAFVRAVRADFDGTIVLAGGISDGAGVVAAQALGADLVYLGTRFIPTVESLATCEYKQAVVAASLDDITTSNQLSGLAANVLTGWLEGQTSGASQNASGFTQERLLGGGQVWAAGHSASGCNDVLPVAALIERLVAEHHRARADLSTNHQPRR